MVWLTTIGGTFLAYWWVVISELVWSVDSGGLDIVFDHLRIWLELAISWIFLDISRIINLGKVKKLKADHGKEYKEVW